jgi:hypothetical protein
MKPSHSLDLLFLADARFEGGTSTALAAEIRAAHQAGIRAGLVFVKGPLLQTSKPTHPAIAALIDDGIVALVDPSLPMTAGVVVIHHPLIMTHRPTRRLRISARAVLLVLHHPATDAEGAEQYDLEPLVDNCIAAFGHDVGLAPVSAVVRQSLPQLLPERSYVINEDWINLIDLGQWPPRSTRAPIYPVVIGRHARPDLAKWPDTRWEALLAYPDDAERYQVRILGSGKFLSKAYGPLPRNWEEKEFDPEAVSPFLMQLDFYVYFHNSKWSEAFGRTIMEAMATELVVILSPLFEPMFGDAAVYCDPVDVKKVIAGFVAEPAAYVSQARRARGFIGKHAGLARFSDRLKRLFPWLAADRGTAGQHPIFLSPERVLFVSTENIGPDHLVQQLAIAARLPRDLQPVFATTSQAMRMLSDAGYLAYLLTHPRDVEADPEAAAKLLAEELFELIAFTRPRVIVFDGTIAPDGLLKALAAYRDILSVWVRRPMWRYDRGHGIARGNPFSVVAEPGNLADDFDHGPTKEFKEQVLCVPPVLRIDPAERRSRAEARGALGLRPDDLVIAVHPGSAQLGSGPTGLRAAVIEEILTHRGALVIDIHSPLEILPRPAADDHPRVKRVARFSTFADSLAFDAAVCEAGYNTFHEQIFGAIPTLFLPNDAPEMDYQRARAVYAELNGLGYGLRHGQDRYRLKEQIAALVDPKARAVVAARCRALPYSNGAGEIARFIADHARMLRTDYDVTQIG